MAVTHIRTDAPGPDWHALCGLFRPPSSISRRLYAAQQRGEAQPFVTIVICADCAAVVARGE